MEGSKKPIFITIKDAASMLGLSEDTFTSPQGWHTSTYSCPIWTLSKIDSPRSRGSHRSENQGKPAKIGPQIHERRMTMDVKF